MKVRFVLASAMICAAAPAWPQAPEDHSMHQGHGDGDMLMWHVHPWSIMAHGIMNVVADYQGGPRGDDKRFAASMFMLMADRPWGAGSFEGRAMLSLDPAMGATGYPLLFQSGESADGRTHLVDRQHPHDAFMELSGRYRIATGERGSAFIYGGLPGEPALGPPAFMHRPSGERIPEAPLTHHWLDSTHITMGVVTLGATQGAFTLEASRFNGREPDERRWDIETRRLDSWSSRITWNALEGLSMQASHGRLASPEALEPETSVRRTTASVSYRTTTLAWGRNDKRGHGARRSLDGWLLESTARLDERGTLFGRLERVRNDELFDDDHPLHGQAFTVGKLSVGYLYDFARTGAFKWSVGALASAFRVPAGIQPYYGAHPRSYMAFLQVRL